MAPWSVSMRVLAGKQILEMGVTGVTGVMFGILAVFVTEVVPENDIDAVCA